VVEIIDHLVKAELSKRAGEVAIKSKILSPFVDDIQRECIQRCSTVENTEELGKCVIDTISHMPSTVEFESTLYRRLQ